MFELIVLGLILAGLTAIARTPVPRQQIEPPTQPAPTLWSARTDWHRFHKPTYLRRGVILESGQLPSRTYESPGKWRSPMNRIGIAVLVGALLGAFGLALGLSTANAVERAVERRAAEVERAVSF